MMDMWWFGPREFGLFGLVAMTLMIAFWGAVIYLIVSLARRSGRRASSRSDAVAILEERYARGEITRDEFVERRRVLEGDPGRG